jgi:hypothetical protein
MRAPRETARDAMATLRPAPMHWSETPAWLRLLAVDAEIYDDPTVATMVRLARRGCSVSERNARIVYDRTYRTRGAS